MKKSTLTLIVVGALSICALIFAVAQDKAVEVMTAVAIDQAAPDFTLTGVDGNEYKLSSFKGKYVVLEWVNFDCPFVKKHYSSGNMQKLQSEYTGNEVVWLSICSSAPGKQGHFPNADLKKRIASEKSVPTAYLIDESGKVGKMYGAKTTPHMFIIDPKGVVRYAGAIDDTPSTKPADIEGSKNYIAAALTSLKAGKGVDVKTSTPYGCSVKY